MTLDKLTQLRIELSKMFIQRDLEVDAVLASLISGEPCILVGEPGTAKTKIIETMSKMINAKYFYYLMTRYTEPDEILGPIDIVKLREQGIYERKIEGRLLTSDIAFLDEIFKTGSATRNILLDIILNKRYINGSRTIPVNMLTLYSASNEVSTDIEDWAFYDRLTIRKFVKSVGYDSWMELLKAECLLEANHHNQHMLMDTKEVKALQTAVQTLYTSLAKNETILSKAVQTFHVLEREGLHLTDRRKGKVLKVACAYAILNSSNNITLDDLADALRVTAINDEDDTKKVAKAISECGLSSFLEAQKKIEQLETELKNMMSKVESNLDNISASDLKAISTLANKLTATIKSAPKNPRIKPVVSQAIQTLKKAQELQEMIIGQLTPIETFLEEGE